MFWHRLKSIDTPSQIKMIFFNLGESILNTLLLRNFQRYITNTDPKMCNFYLNISFDLCG